MKKAELLELVGGAHARLGRSLEGLSEGEAGRTGLTAKWSIKDALAHITAWEQEGARLLGGILDGTARPRRYPEEEIERFNEEAVGARRGRTLDELLGETRAGHAAMLAAVARLPDEVDENSPAYKIAHGFTVEHMTHHAAQIEKYRESSIVRES
ncbi:MAG: maleylpyruvate isomerase N-terminal domain-containing protein [Acidobacteriota bacterium]|nr:maleylpyruvate isomerase N-terminal domain-containing protein [Acidobacteriota bacterium]